MAEGEGSVPITAKMIMDRDEFLQELREINNSMQETVRTLSKLEIRIPLMLDDKVTDQVQRIIRQLESRVITIPARLALEGGLAGALGGGMGWRGRTEQAQQAISVMSGAPISPWLLPGGGAVGLSSSVAASMMGMAGAGSVPLTSRPPPPAIGVRARMESILQEVMSGESAGPAIRDAGPGASPAWRQLPAPGEATVGPSGTASAARQWAQNYGTNPGYGPMGPGGPTITPPPAATTLAGMGGGPAGPGGGGVINIPGMAGGGRGFNWRGTGTFMQGWSTRQVFLPALVAAHQLGALADEIDKGRAGSLLTSPQVDTTAEIMASRRRSLIESEHTGIRGAVGWAYGKASSLVGGAADLITAGHKFTGTNERGEALTASQIGEKYHVLQPEYQSEINLLDEADLQSERDKRRMAVSQSRMQARHGLEQYGRQQEAEIAGSGGTDRERVVASAAAAQREANLFADAVDEQWRTYAHTYKEGKDKADAIRNGAKTIYNRTVGKFDTATASAITSMGLSVQAIQAEMGGDSHSAARFNTQSSIEQQSHAAHMESKEKGEYFDTVVAPALRQQSAFVANREAASQTRSVYSSFRVATAISRGDTDQADREKLNEEISAREEQLRATSGTDYTKFVVDVAPMMRSNFDRSVLLRRNQEAAASGSTVEDTKSATRASGLRANMQINEADAEEFNRGQDSKVEKLKQLMDAETDVTRHKQRESEYRAGIDAAESAKTEFKARQERILRASVDSDLAGITAAGQRSRGQRWGSETTLIEAGWEERLAGMPEGTAKVAAQIRREAERDERAGARELDSQHIRVQTRQAELITRRRPLAAELMGIQQQIIGMQEDAGDDRDRHDVVNKYGGALLRQFAFENKPQATFGLSNETYWQRLQEQSSRGNDAAEAVRKALELAGLTEGAGGGVIAGRMPNLDEAADKVAKKFRFVGVVKE